MSDHTSEPHMCWETTNLVESFKFFRQQCELYFSVRGIAEDKQVDNILLLSGKEGIRRYNSWSFVNEADRCNPSVIWEKFLEQLAPQVNFRIARFYLQNYSQNETENIDDFLARCRLQAHKCKFRDERELEERVIDQLIVGTKFPELQKQQLSKNETMTMTMPEVLNMCRSYETSIEYMKKMGELQRKSENPINGIKHRHKGTDICGRCGLHLSMEIALLGTAPAQHVNGRTSKSRKKLTGCHKRTGLPSTKNSDQHSLHSKTVRAVLTFRTRCLTNLRGYPFIQCMTTEKRALGQKHSPHWTLYYPT